MTELQRARRRLLGRAVEYAGRPGEAWHVRAVETDETGLKWFIDLAGDRDPLRGRLRLAQWGPYRHLRLVDKGKARA